MVALLEHHVAAHQIVDGRRAVGDAEPQHAAGCRLETTVAGVAVVPAAPLALARSWICSAVRSQ